MRPCGYLRADVAERIWPESAPVDQADERHDRGVGGADREMSLRGVDLSEKQVMPA